MNKRLLVLILFQLTFIFLGSEKMNHKELYAPSFSMVYQYEVPKEAVALGDFLTRKKGYSQYCGDGFFSYGVWLAEFNSDFEESHFYKKHVDKKIVVTRDFREVLMLSAKRLEESNFLELPESEYLKFQEFSRKDQITYFLSKFNYSPSDRGVGKIFYDLIKLSQYASRKDVLILHYEDLIRSQDLSIINEDLKKMVRFIDLKTLPSPENFLSFKNELFSSSEQEAEEWQQVFDEELSQLYNKTVGYFQINLGYQ